MDILLQLSCFEINGLFNKNTLLFQTALNELKLKLLNCALVSKVVLVACYTRRHVLKTICNLHLSPDLVNIYYVCG